VEWSRTFRARVSLLDPPLDKWLKEEPLSTVATDVEQVAKFRSLTDDSSRKW
jgi:hypothetical protein